MCLTNISAYCKDLLTENIIESKQLETGDRRKKHWQLTRTYKPIVHAAQAKENLQRRLKEQESQLSLF